jgi:hypothetical protein
MRRMLVIGGLRSCSYNYLFLATLYFDTCQRVILQPHGIRSQTECSTLIPASPTIARPNPISKHSTTHIPKSRACSDRPAILHSTKHSLKAVSTPLRRMKHCATRSLLAAPFSPRSLFPPYDPITDRNVDLLASAREALLLPGKTW